MNDKQQTMTPIKTVRLMRGISQTELAARMGISPQSLNQYESGARSLGPKLLPLAAGALGVSSAYLREDAQRLAVRDFITGETAVCAIMSETVIDAYGMFYLVEHAQVGPIAVILSDGMQFTLGDWQGKQPLTRDEIADCSWVDAYGHPAIMLDGLPRVLR